eukprot:TRINITY_DN7434_c0_g1_i5.p1 TRINITY_DN7434_c0_g1~~TRINITY_DN7434_c0_g1_i5.p1  ORF type:complete len:310 (-),score=71.25 TRINITY_DN7434_c0_g1_i5:314-1243(-)
MKKKWFEEKQTFCSQCWLMKVVCMCERSKTLSISIPHQLYLYLHYKEYGRSTNTGVSLLQALPANTHLVVLGDPEGEKTLNELAVNFPLNTFVLFPSSRAVEFPEFLSTRHSPRSTKKVKLGEDELSTTDVVQIDTHISSSVFPTTPVSIPPPNLVSPAGNLENQFKKQFPCDEVFNIIILDSTWNQAKLMAKRLPEDLPHVKLGECARPTISDLRIQTSLDRVTTAEAVALLLEEMGTSSLELQKMWDWIASRISAGQQQGGRPPGSIMLARKKEVQEEIHRKNKLRKPQKENSDISSESGHVTDPNG